ncbi:nucleotide-binding protein [Pseudomonas sp. BW16M2]|uniref:TIR domain-containing protein n=1 Tax=Pseudomonas sp. BW16M2 TaxID=2745489 RepID=UPI0016451760|nr:nucleotide-binding protein [Pseudomonas sp. BW16M2]MBC3434857.1 nucleotide-binding protein [Pseudomonas sp. BW16M2]
MRKPRVFIASSVEGMNVANAVNESLDYDVELVHWKDSFKLSSYSVDDLMEKSRTVDFAIFIFTPDDVSTIRAQVHAVARDNVLFELGLFIGSLSRERCFIVKPRGVEMHFPTDLIGLTPADFDGNRSDGDLTQAVNAPCIKIKKEISRLGLASEDKDIIKARVKKTGFNYNIGIPERKPLLTIFEKCIHLTEGVPSGELFTLKNESEFLSIAAIKLERLGLIEKAIHADNNWEYYTYSVTADGIDYILTNEEEIKSSRSSNPTSPPAPPHSFDDDIPF